MPDCYVFFIIQMFEFCTWLLIFVHASLPIGHTWHNTWNWGVWLMFCSYIFPTVHPTMPPKTWGNTALLHHLFSYGHCLSVQWTCMQVKLWLVVILPCHLDLRIGKKPNLGEKTDRGITTKANCYTEGQ